MAIAALLLAAEGSAHATAVCAAVVRKHARPEAARLAAEGKAAMMAARYDDALRLFQKAFCVAPESVTLHLISSAALNLGRCHEARAEAERWSRGATAKAEKAEVRAWLAELNRQCVAVTIESAPAPARFHLDEAEGASLDTPWHGELLSGRHMIFAGGAAGLLPLQEQITVPRGRRSSPFSVLLKLRRGVEGVLAAARAKAPATPAPPDAVPVDPPGSQPAIAAPAPSAATSPAPPATAIAATPAVAARTSGRAPSNPGANVPRGLWVKKVSDALPPAVCNTAYFKECFTSTRDECIAAAQRTEGKCFDEQLPLLPDYFDQKSGNEWGGKIGSCAGMALEGALMAQKSADPKCSDASRWQ